MAINHIAERVEERNARYKIQYTGTYGYIGGRTPTIQSTRSSQDRREKGAKKDCNPCIETSSQKLLFQIESCQGGNTHHQRGRGLEQMLDDVDHKQYSQHNAQQYD